MSLFYLPMLIDNLIQKHYFNITNKGYEIKTISLLKFKSKAWALVSPSEGIVDNVLKR